MLIFNREALAEYIELEQAAGLNLIDELIGDYLTNSVQLTEAITRSAQSRDLPLLERSAHSLKSSSRLLGLEAVGELAWQIERDARDGICRAGDAADLVGLLGPARSELSQFRAAHRDQRLKIS